MFDLVLYTLPAVKNFGLTFSTEEIRRNVFTPQTCITGKP